MSGKLLVVRAYWLGGSVNALERPQLAPPTQVRSGYCLSSLQRTQQPLQAVVKTIRSWLGRRDRTAKLEIDGDTLELTGISSETEERLVTAWVDRHPVPDAVYSPAPVLLGGFLFGPINLPGCDRSP
jgi:hypothetical protein